ncbi:hypothetical protein [Myxococcus sp. CA039A]|uniref:hypothetical protein n=1 Tax=Myxococcus sp. CA039A TaxID=2741737 RepID=UPI00157B7186|nr:hypothetical protein [Myxococcus sp. CA039A]NTX53273.1 hypothetical protein [Myxococcus sp. CA039A]
MSCGICGKSVGAGQGAKAVFCTSCTEDLKAEGVPVDWATKQYLATRLQSTLQTLQQRYQRLRAQSAAGSGASAVASKPSKEQVPKNPKGAATGSAAAAAAAGASSLGKHGEGRGGHRRRKPLTPEQQIQLDSLYSDLQLPYVDILVNSADQNGFGDLINGLHTGRLLHQGTGWRIVATSNHSQFDTMLSSFPWVSKVQEVGWSPDISLETPAATTTEGDLAVSEYSYRVGRALDVFTRQSGLGDGEIGIMINKELRAPIPLAELKLSDAEKSDAEKSDAEKSTKALCDFLRKYHQGCRFFFGYGAGQKSKARYDLLLDRVVFDVGIKNAIVLPVNHNLMEQGGAGGKGRRNKASYIGEYCRTRGLRVLEVEKNKWFSVSTLIQDDRTTKVVAMEPGAVIPYSVMQKLWRAADRSFTIAEGDQSFGEAISAGIPMAYQLWPDGKGIIHKQTLFDNFVKRSGGGDVAEFVRVCANYPDGGVDVRQRDWIIERCNDRDFLRRYVNSMDLIASNHDIQGRLQCFVKRHWLRNNRARLLGINSDLGALVGEIVELEDRGEFDLVVAQTRKMVAMYRAVIFDFNVKQGVLDKGPGSVAKRAAAVKDALNPGPGGAAGALTHPPVATGTFNPELLNLISDYERTDVLPAMGPMGAAGASPAAEAAAAAAAGAAPVGVSAAAAAGVASPSGKQGAPS